MTSEVPNPGLTTNSQLNHLVKDAQAIGMELKGLASFVSHKKKKKQWTCILFSHKEHGNQAIHRREARTDSPSATMSTLNIPSHSSAATFLDHPSVIHLWSSIEQNSNTSPYGWSMLIPYSSWEPHPFYQQVRSRAWCQNACGPGSAPAPVGTSSKKRPRPSPKPLRYDENGKITGFFIDLSLVPLDFSRISSRFQENQPWI